MLYSICSTLEYVGHVSPYNPRYPHPYPLKGVYASPPSPFPLSQLCRLAQRCWGPGVSAMATEQAEAARLRPAAEAMPRHKLGALLQEVPLEALLQQPN